MDQAKSMLPHFIDVRKSVFGMWKLKVHLLACIIHGIGVIGYFDMFEYSHGSNLSLNILLAAILQIPGDIPKCFICKWTIALGNVKTGTEHD